MPKTYHDFGREIGRGSHFRNYQIDFTLLLDAQRKFREFDAAAALNQNVGSGVTIDGICIEIVTPKLLM